MKKLLLLLPLLFVSNISFAEYSEKLEGEHFIINIKVNCEEGNLDCNNVSYTGIRKKDQAKVSLTGKTINNPDTHDLQGYEFQKGDISYFVYKNICDLKSCHDVLEVRKKDKLLLSEKLGAQDDDLNSENNTNSVTTDLLSWPRARPDTFGCFLERQFGYKDPHFNCFLTHYENKGDACKNTDAYYEGPEFPESKVQQVNSNLQFIKLYWEHGALQNIWMCFNKKLSAAEVHKILNISIIKDVRVEDSSITYNSPRENVMSVSIDNNGKNPTTCLTITGFDHMGAGDVDCDSGQ